MGGFRYCEYGKCYQQLIVCYWCAPIFVWWGSYCADQWHFTIFPQVRYVEDPASSHEPKIISLKDVDDVLGASMNIYTERERSIIVPPDSGEKLQV